MIIITMIGKIEKARSCAVQEGKVMRKRTTLCARGQRYVREGKDICEKARPCAKRISVITHNQVAEPEPEPKHFFVRSEPEPDLRLRLRLKMMHMKNLLINFKKIWHFTVIVGFC